MNKAKSTMALGNNQDNRGASHDEALAVLRKTYDEVDPDFDFTLVKRCYEIEREYQYDRERELPINELRTQVTLAVERLLSSEEDASK